MKSNKSDIILILQMQKICSRCEKNNYRSLKILQHVILYI